MNNVILTTIDEDSNTTPNVSSDITSNQAANVLTTIFFLSKGK